MDPKSFEDLKAVEDKEFYISMREEIRRLFGERSPIVKNYGILLHALRATAKPKFKGSRGCALIHKAMRKQIKWAHNWDRDGFMSQSEEFFKKAEEKYREERGHSFDIAASITQILKEK